MKLQRSLSFVIIGALFAACSQQGEGQRCITANGDADCESGLVCVAQSKLATEAGKVYGADRCCPPEKLRWNDARCERVSGRSDSGVAGSGNTGNSSAAAGSAGASNGGSSGLAGASSGGDLGQAGAAAAPSDNGSAGVAGTLP